MVLKFLTSPRWMYKEFQWSMSDQQTDRTQEIRNSKGFFLLQLNNNCSCLKSPYCSSGSGHTKSSGKLHTLNDMAFTQFFEKTWSHRSQYEEHRDTTNSTKGRKTISVLQQLASVALQSISTAYNNCQNNFNNLCKS